MLSYSKMSIDLKVFNRFVIENNKIFDIKSYPIDKSKAEKWINKHSDEYAKIAARFIVSCIKHVSFQDIYSILSSMADEMINIASTNDIPIVLTLSSPELHKSSFFITLILYSIFMKKDKTNMIEAIYIDLEQIGFIKHPCLVVISEDASYSGAQLSIYLSKLKMHANSILYLAVPYLSSKAQTKLKRYKNSISSYTSTFETLPIYFKHSQLYKDIDKKNRKYVMNYIPNVHALYLDFKLPDSYSIIQLILSYGFTLDDQKVDAETLISHCEDYYNTETLNNITRDTYDIQDILKPEGMCPPPIYKLYKYTYKGKSIILEDLLKLED